MDVDGQWDGSGRNEETLDQVQGDVAVDDQRLQLRQEPVWWEPVDPVEQVPVVERDCEALQGVAPPADLLDEVRIDPDLFRVLEHQPGQFREAGSVESFVPVVPGIVLELEALQWAEPGHRLGAVTNLEPEIKLGQLRRPR